VTFADDFATIGSITRSLQTPAIYQHVSNAPNLWDIHFISYRGATTKRRCPLSC